MKFLSLAVRTRPILQLALLMVASVGQAAAGSLTIKASGIIVTNEITLHDRAEIEMVTDFPQGQIFYTLDGSQPSFASARYATPVELTTNATIRAVAYSGDFSQTATNTVRVNVARYFWLYIIPDPNYADPPGGLYPENTVVKVTAVDRNGWMFSRWAGAVNSTNREVQVTLDSQKVLNEVFKTEIKTFTTPGGKIVLGTNIVESGTSVSVQAVPDPGYSFAAWGKSLVGNQNPTELYVGGPVLFANNPPPEISAAFAPLPQPPTLGLRWVGSELHLQSENVPATAVLQISTDLVNWHNSGLSDVSDVVIPTTGAGEFYRLLIP